MSDLTHDKSTTAILIPGQPFRGVLDQLGDRDWIAITLTAGQRLTLDLASDTAGAALSDPYLRLFGPDGRYMAGDDDSGDNLNARLSVDIHASGIYYIEAAAFDDGHTGDYILAATLARATSLATPQLPAGPLRSLAWGTQLTDNVVTVSFLSAGTAADGIRTEAFNAYEIGQFKKAFAAISAVTDLRFAITGDSDADFRIGLDTNQSGRDYYGYFNSPGEVDGGFGLFNGALWDRTPGGDLEVGGNGFSTIVHELLHGLGLAHPHDRGGASDIMAGIGRAFGDYGTADLNQGVYTIMSYNEGYATRSPRTAFPDTGHAAGPMALDIAVLQSLYGANTTTAGGDDSYRMQARTEGWTAIWDTGGRDTIHFDGSQDVTIDLRMASLRTAAGGGGYVSHVDGAAGGFTIAAGVRIENAAGGRGNDLLRGNELANVLLGGSGCDRLSGLSGNDVLRGGSGNDALYGNGGNDRLSGDGGRDMIDGGHGNDRLYGSSGSDRLTGGAGADWITGGTGLDTFVFQRKADSGTGSANADRITDMEAGRDLIWLRNIDADLTRSGNQAFAFRGTDGFTDAGQLRLIQSRGDTFVQMDLDGDRRADMAIVIYDVVGLMVDDFIL